MSSMHTRGQLTRSGSWAPRRRGAQTSRSTCPDPLGNGLTLTTSDDYFSKDLSDRGHEASRGGAGQRAGIQK